MADDCSAGFAIMPIIMIFVFVAILSRALRSASRGGGGYVHTGGTRYRTYRSNYYATQYLARQGSYRPYQAPYAAPPAYRAPPYQAPYAAPPAYRAPPYQAPYAQPPYQQPGYGQPPYGQPGYVQPPYGQPGYAQPGYVQPRQFPQQPAYATYQTARYGSGFQPAPAPAYQPGPPAAAAPPQPAPEPPKKTCNYCGSLNPGTESNCLLCGAPIR